MRMQTIFIDGPLNEDWPKRTQDITDYPLFPEPLTSSVSVGFFGGEFVAACEAHGEFACKSKACAPPPVGTGGSLPSASGTEGSAERGGHTPKVIAVRSWDEIEEKFGVDGTGERHVYRSVSEADYQRMKRQGFLDTDGRGNISADEGLVTAKHLPWVYLGDIARKGADDNPTGTGRILKIRREASDGWREDRDGYIKTSDKVPFDRVEMVTMPIGVRREVKYYGEPGDEGNSTTRTFYDWSAADRPLTASACEAHGEFECKSRACAPPPVGTGGSLPTAAQHVTSREAAASIKSGGFVIGPLMHGKAFGNGVYLSRSGDKKVANFYRKATKSEGYAPALVNATVRLKNPLKASGQTMKEVIIDMIKNMGGYEVFRKAAQTVLEKKTAAVRKALSETMGKEFLDQIDWEGNFDAYLSPVYDKMTRDQYKDFLERVQKSLVGKEWASEISVADLRGVIRGDSSARSVATLSKELGYDGIEITNDPFSSEVGGSQIVVFDPKSITVESVEDFGALIERLGIEVTYEFNESALTACAVHGEFACNSRSCAPPPVGTGGSISTGVGDLARAALSGGMSGIYTARGFDAKPRVVSGAQFSHLVRQGKVRESWRGISLAGGEKSVPEDVARAFERADKHPVVEGSFGSGTYVAFGKFGEREARQYAGKGGSVLRIGIPPKMGSEPALRQITEVVDRMTRGGEGVKAFDRQNIAAGVRLYKSLRDAGITDSEVKRLASDAGVIGMLLGWDGVYVSNGEGGVGYAVVWNRGATVVDSEVLTASVSVGFVDGGLVFACEEHGEFACTSRACAPPPVGRGGSLPSGGSSDGSSPRGSRSKSDTSKTRTKGKTEFGKRINKMIADDPRLKPLRWDASDRAAIRKQVAEKYRDDLQRNLSKADLPDPDLFRQLQFERLVNIKASGDTDTTLQVLKTLMNPKLADPSYMPEPYSVEEALHISIQRILSGKIDKDIALLPLQVDGKTVAVEFGVDVDDYKSEYEILKLRSLGNITSDQMFATINVGTAVRSEIVNRIRSEYTPERLEVERQRHTDALERIRKRLIEFEPVVDDVDLTSPNAYGNTKGEDNTPHVSPDMFKWTMKIGVVVDYENTLKARRTLVSLMKEEGIIDLEWEKHFTETMQIDAEKVIEDTIAEVRQLGGVPKASPSLRTTRGDDLVKELIEGARLLPSAWIDASNARVPMTILESAWVGDRAHYSNMRSEIMLNGDIDVARHELAHRMEYSVDGLLHLEREFFAHRTQPNPNFRKLNDLVLGGGYGDNEIADPDQFFDPYVGKSYNGRAYEIMSMGVQHVFKHLAYEAQGKTVTNPQTGASALMDLEYIDFVIGAMLTTQWET